MTQESNPEKLPKTARGRQTREKLLRAAEVEFGKKGFHDASVSSITQHAGVALGSFYTYFESKEEIYRALVGYMGHRVRSWIAERIADSPDRVSAERDGLQAYLEFVRRHPGLYRIIAEAEFVANDAYVEHYTGIAKAYTANLGSARERGEICDGDFETWSWALMGMMVFLGMRYGEWDQQSDPKDIANRASALIAEGIANRK